MFSQRASCPVTMKFSRRKRRRGALRILRALLRPGAQQQAVHTLGNRVTLYAQGGDFFPALFAAAAAAESSILAEFYRIKDDRTGREFAQALLDAAGRGVAAALIYDVVGCFDTPVAYFRRLEAGGVRCLPFNPPAFSRLHWLDIRDHRKLVVLDGVTAFLGGLNVGDEYAGFGDSLHSWRDVGIRLDGPAAGELRTLFRETWRQEGAEAMPLPADDPAEPQATGDADVMVVNGTPRRTRSVIGRSFRLAMAVAHYSIRIMTPYFVPGPRVIRALLRALRHGVRVQMILPSVSDVPLVKRASRVYLAPLLQAGAELYERQGTILHAKVMLIDDRWVTLGSANLDLRSFHRNHEINVVIDSREFGGQVRRMFADDLVQSRRIDAAEFARQGLFERLLTWLLSPLSRFL